MTDLESLTQRVLSACAELARMSEEPGRITRTFLSPPMRQVHAYLKEWMERLGMSVWVDPIGNLRGYYPANKPTAPRLLIGSHLDTVPNGGAYDGALGVVLAVAVLEALQGRRLGFGVEVIGFSEEEGVRFGVPFLGSRALVGRADAALLALKDEQGVSVAQAVREFGLEPEHVREAALQGEVLGYLEFHIEQGPVLESLEYPLGLVEAIVGQSRLEVGFRGKANHAGTTPMHLRRDALAGAAEWIGLVEREAWGEPGLVATVGQIQALPGAGNVIPGEVRCSLDVRHVLDEVRTRSVANLITRAQQVAQRRGLELAWEVKLDQGAVPCDPTLLERLEWAVQDCELPVHRMPSGAGHDAMIMAERVPSAMLFLRSPGGLSHHPDEGVLPEDVTAALRVGLRWLEILEEHGV